MAAPADNALLARLYAEIPNELLLRIMQYCCDDADTLATLEKVSRRMYRLCNGHALWYDAYMQHFPIWSNGLGCAMLPVAHWKRCLLRELSTRARWRSFGERVAQVQSMPDHPHPLSVWAAPNDEDDFEDFDTVSDEHSAAISDTDFGDSDDSEEEEYYLSTAAALAQLQQQPSPNPSDASQQTQQIDELELQDMPDQPHSPNGATPPIVAGEEGALATARGTAEQFLCMVKPRDPQELVGTIIGEDLPLTPHLTDFLVHDYDSDQTGIVACGTSRPRRVDEEESGAEVLVWTFPDWRLAARIPFHPLMTGDSHLREQLIDVSWTARLLITSVYDRRDRRWHSVRIYDFDNDRNDPQPIGAFDLPRNDVQVLYACALPTSLERAQSSTTVRWQDRLEVLLICLDQAHRGPILIHYRHQAPLQPDGERHSVQVTQLTDERIYQVLYDPRWPDHIITLHADNRLVVWLLSTGQPLAHLTLPLPWESTTARLTSALPDNRYDAPLSRLIVTATDETGGHPGILKIFVYAFLANSSCTREDASTAAVDDDLPVQSMAAPLHRPRFSREFDDKPFPMPDSDDPYYTYLHTLYTAAEKVAQQQSSLPVQARLLYTTDFTTQHVVYRFNTRTSLLFCEDQHNQLFALDLTTGQRLFNLHCSAYANVLVVGVDIVRLEQFAFTRLAVDRSDTLETVEL